MTGFFSTFFHFYPHKNEFKNRIKQIEDMPEEVPIFVFAFPIIRINNVILWHGIYYGHIIISQSK